VSDLKSLSYEVFEPCVDQAFEVLDDADSPVAMTLLAVEKRGQYDPDFADRQAFSLIFRGPAEPVLVQSTRPVRNDGLGTLDIFLVPIGPDKKGMRYEAVFT